MDKDLVIGIDCSTTATKAIAWDGRGRLVAEGRSALALRNPQPGFYEQDAREWWQSACAALGELGAKIDMRRVAALSIANQRETFVALDAAGEPLGPAITWLDERGREDVLLLSKKLGRDRLLAITGKTPDPTPCLYALHWLMRKAPALYGKAAHFLEVHGYLVWRLTGLYRTSWASADPTGVYDLAAKRYSEPILDALRLTPKHFAAAVAPGSAVGEVTGEAAAATGLEAGTLVVAGGGDGQAGGLGVGTLVPGRAYLNLGTASVSGVYGEAYATDPAFRTMTSVSGEGYIFELCLRTGTFLVDWLVKGVFGADPTKTPSIYQKLEAEAAAVPAGAGGLLLQPYWGGSMTPYWDQDARGVIVGLSGEHGRGHLYRAMMEGIALDQAMGTANIERVTGQPVTELMTFGGGARSDLWCGIIADATNKPVRRLATVEASSLGAAIAAAKGTGWFPTAKAAVAAMAGKVETTIEPDQDRHAVYGELLAIFEKLYPATSEVQAALAAFKHRRTDTDGAEEDDA
jgi:sugar (pentulose or hexulose) kinase